MVNFSRKNIFYAELSSGKSIDIVLEKNAATKFYTEKAQILTKQLKKSSKLHANQAKMVANYVKKNEKKKRPKKRNRKKT